MKNLKSIIALLVLTVFSVNVWGNGTFDLAYSKTDVKSAEWNLTNGDVKITFNKGTSQNTPSPNQEGSVRMYSGTTLKIESTDNSKKITKVVFTKKGNSYGSNNLTYNNTALPDGTWELTTPVSSVTLTATANARFSEIVVTTAADGPVKLGTPTGLSSSNVTKNSATIEWNKVTNASGYSVSCTGATVGGISVGATKASCQLTGLSKATQYTWKVKATGDGTSYADGDYSSTANFTTLGPTFTDFITECSSDPSISVSAAELSGFTYIYSQGPSVAQTVMVNGFYLQNNVTVTASDNYEICLSQDGTYTNTINLTPADQMVNAPVYVRLKAGKNVDSYNGTLTVASSGLDSKNVTLSGSVSAQPLATPSVTATSGVHQITLSWNEVLNASSYQLVWNGGAVETVTSPVTKTDLTGGQSYSYSLVAVGSGNYTNSAADEGNATAGKETFTVKFFNSGSELTELEKHIEEGATLGTLPTLTESCDPKSTTFVGWTSEEAWDGKVASFNKFVTSSTSVNAAMTLNAVWAEETVVPSEDFTQVTSLDNVTDGNYVISYTYNSTTIILKNETSSQTELKAISQSPSSSKYTNPNEAYVWELKKENGNYSVYNASVKKYLNATSSGLTLSETPTYFTLSYNSGFIFKLTNETNNYYLSGYISGSNYTFQTTTSNRKLYLYKQGTTTGRRNFITTCSSDPLIEVSTTELTGFSTIATTGNPSAAKSFTVEGYNLTEDITISVSNGYEICQTENGTYSKNIILTQSDGKVAKTTLYVRLVASDYATGTGEATGTITIASEGVSPFKEISLSGTVIAAVTVTFNNNGSTDGAPAAIKLAQGGTLGSNLPGVGSMTAPISGYAFVGWVTDGDKWDGFTPSLTKSLITGNEIIDTDITYDAVWAKGSNDFELMGNNDPFTDGNYIITYDSYNGLKAMGNVVSGSNITTIGVDDQDEGIIANNTEAKVVWTLHKTGTNTVTFYNADKGQYLQGTSSALSFTNTPVDWTWSMTPGEDDYAPKYKFSIGTNGLYYLSNEFQYHSSPDPLYIYKQQISNFFVTIPDEYTVIWHKGNAGTETSSAFEGQTFADIVADAPSVDDNAAGDCANTFMGWATSAITKDEATEEDVSWAKDNTTPISGDVEYYAVFAYKEGVEAQTAKITPTDISGWTGMAYATSYNKTSADGTTWSMQGVWTNGSNVDNLQMNNTSGRAITTPAFASNITKIEFNAKGKDITIYDASGNEIKSQTLGSTADDYVIDMSDVEYNQVKIANKTSGTTNIYSLTITYGSATYSNYVTQCTPKYDVKFYTDNGTTQYGETQSIEENSYATAPTTNPENDCSDFKGWSKTWGGDVVTVGEVQIIEPTNFYAIWDAIKPVLDAENPKDNVATQGFDAADLKVIVSAPSASTCLTYQWQKSTNATTDFEDISGATASTYTPSTVEANTTYYRCVVTNGDESTESRVATISVVPVTKCFAPAISIATGKAGFIRSTFVTLTTETDGATIYYTKDGVTTPSAETSKYTEPFEITENTTIKAIAIKSEMTNSDVAEATFTPATMQSIEVKTEPKKEYTASETFDPSNLVITATYNYDLSEEVAYADHESEFTFDPALTTELGVDVEAVKIGWGEKETEQKITVNCIEIAAPEVAESKQGSTGITLTWSAVENAASYQVKWNGVEAETPTYNIESSKYEFVKSGLTANTSYTYEVIAVGETNYCNNTTGEKSITTNKKSCESIDNAHIVKNPTDFYVGESIEPSQFTVDKHYDNGDVVTEAPSKAEIEGVENPLTDAQVGEQTVTLTFNYKTTTIEITVKPQPVVTWSINGNEDNKQSFAYNAALVLPEAPAAPQTCAEKTFVGWTTETYKDYDSDDAPAVLFTEAGDRKVTEDVTYYAVFAMVNVVPDEVDVIDNAATKDEIGETGTTAWADISVEGESEAKYQIHTMGIGDNEYAMSFNKNGYFYATATATSGKYLKSITINGANKKFNIFASNSAYSAKPTENRLEQITVANNTATYNFTDNYKFIAVNGTESSSTITSVEIVYAGVNEYSAYSTKCAARTPEKIEITHEATKTFDVNDEFTSEGLEITASYNTGNPQVVTDYCTITAPDMTTAGEKDVNISYTENDVTVYTSYKINVRQPYYVMYESNGATTGTVPSDTKKYYTGEKVTVLANESLVKTNNVFKGWSYAGTTYQADEQVTVGTEDITLTAVWEEKMPCTITLSENGNISTVTDKSTGDAYTLPTTITNNVTGYAFMGWSTQEIDEPVATTEPGTFFAKGEQMTLTESAYTFYAVYARTSGTSSDYNAGKVTTDADIVAGGLYIFAIGDYAMNNTVESDAVQMTQNFAKTGLSSTDAIVFTLESATDGYYIKNNGGKYLLNGSKTNMSFSTYQTATTATAIWTFSYNTQKTSNAWQIQNTKNDDRFLGNPDASTHTIKAYSTSNWDTYPHAITIYRLVGGYTTAPTIVVNGTTVQTVPANFHGNVIVENVGAITLDEPTTWKNLTIKNGGKVTTNAALSIKDLLIETKMGAGTGKTNSPNMKGASGQLIIGDGGSVTASGSAIIENQIDPTGTATQGWYSFSVPFPVSAQNGIYFGDAKLTNGVDYAIMEYLGDVRAQGQYGWKKYSGILQPGKMYVIAVTDSDYGKLRFQKTADGALVANNSWTAGIYGGGEETDANWNAIGNPNLAIAQFVNNSGAGTLQFYDHTTNTFTGYAKGELNIVVGSGFFIQAVAEYPSITMNVKETTSGRGYRAPAEDIEEEMQFIAIQLLQGDAMNDQVFLNADVNATLSYEIGRDVAKFFMQGETKCAQIYVPAYGTNLCAAQFPLNANNEAMFPLTITAPKDGTYTIAAENVPENVDLFLEQNGALIWNLSTSAYEINLNKGETKDYSIRWNAHSSSTPTGNNAIKSDAKVQKIFYQQNIYIIQENQMYNAQGIKVQ